MKPKYTDAIPRRQVMGGILAGLATATVSYAASADQTPTKTGEGVRPPAERHNPVTKYPKPPFQSQSQPWPGLASKMSPRPDHGETSYRGSGRLRGRAALVTGGDSGIGRAAAIAFAREGADVAINYLPAEETDAEEVIALIRAEGRKAVAIPGDIRQEDFCNKLVSTAAAKLGGLNLLVNVAGRQQERKSILEITTADFDATLKTNLYALFWITKAAIPHLPAGAAIINTASEQAYAPSADLLDYALTKAGIMNFTKSLAKQLAPRGIRVNAVAPGPVWTPLQVSGGQSAETLPKFGEDSPLGRPGQPAEMAPIFVLLAADEASYATGQVYGASGGKGNP
jgi:NAD(P)-dependent dehydrogenase (short-subunit alcohol dehydrogenase family)